MEGHSCSCRIRVLPALGAQCWAPGQLASRDTWPRISLPPRQASGCSARVSGGSHQVLTQVRTDVHSGGWGIVSGTDARLHGYQPPDHLPPSAHILLVPECLGAPRWYSDPAPSSLLPRTSPFRWPFYSLWAQLRSAAPSCALCPGGFVILGF